jgi:hypothetical protein
MEIISAGIQRAAVIILALTSFLLLSASQAFAQNNSPASAQKGDDCTFSHDVNAKTITFEAVNPKTQGAGRMTVSIIGAVRGTQLWNGQSAVGSHLSSDTQEVFSFVPNDPYSPIYSGTVKQLQLSGDTKDDSISFDFGLKATGTDGSVQWFMLREVVTANDAGVQIAFKQLPTPEKLIAQPEIPCGSLIDDKDVLVKSDKSASARP